MDAIEPYREEAFWAKVDRRDAAECWLWTAALNDYGYGRFRLGGSGTKYAMAHRIAYTLLVEPIPTERQIDHLCRNRACVNPAHLEPVTPRVNTLRGESAQARNAKKTHCPKGHPLFGENLLVSGGRRICRTCKRAQYAERIKSGKVAAYMRTYRARKRDQD